jgi:hypothetical protein
MLDLNIEVMKRMQAAALKVRDGNRSDAINEGLESAMSEHVFLRKNVLSLVERATILSNQVRAPTPLPRLLADMKQSFETQSSSATANSIKTFPMPVSAERQQWSICRTSQATKLELSKH